MGQLGDNLEQIKEELKEEETVRCNCCECDNIIKSYDPTSACPRCGELLN